MKTEIINGFAVYKDRATGICIVRNRQTGEEIAHEPNMENARIAARRAK